MSGLRSNFITAQDAVHHHIAKGNTDQPNGNSSSNSSGRHSWTDTKDSTIYIPAVDTSRSGLSEERLSYEITVKIFFLPNNSAAKRRSQASEALSLVLQELRVDSVDLLVVSYPGIVYDVEQPVAGHPKYNQQSDCEDGDARPEDVDTMLSTWESLEELHDQGLVKKLGVSEFGTNRLEPFLKKARIKPSVDQINVKDACVVPQELIAFAKQSKIDLLTHNDCTNILPQGTVRDLLGPSEIGILAGESSDGLRGNVEPQWVVKYTAIVRDRGVIENKGYFAMAEVADSR